MSQGAVQVLAVIVFLGVIALLLRQHLHTRRILEHELDRLERQNDIGRVLLTDRNVRGVTRHVAESAASMVGSDLAHVTLVSEQDPRLVVEAATGPLATAVGSVVPREGTMAGWVIGRGQPLVLNDPLTHPGFKSLHERIELKRAVMLPLIARGRCIGALGVDNPRDGRAFGPADVAQLRDLADYAALTIEAIQAIEELERANKMKAQFLANMSHELRTPLNSVIGFAEILMAGSQHNLSGEQQDALQTIARNGRHLLGLVNDILDIAKVDAGRMDLHLAPVDLGRLVPGVLGEMETQIHDKGHRLTVDLTRDPLVVRADEIRARQVLQNLVSNAIKFTAPGGTITVRARRRAGNGSARGLPAAREIVLVSVTDTGIGIAEQDLPRLFSEFSQVDASYARRYEGTGLGLSLCKRFMEMHGGAIGVDSAAGRGSTFWVEFPVEGPEGR